MRPSARCRSRQTGGSGVASADRSAPTCASARNAPPRRAASGRTGRRGRCSGAVPVPASLSALFGGGAAIGVKAAAVAASAAGGLGLAGERHFTSHGSATKSFVADRYVAEPQAVKPDAAKPQAAKPHRAKRDPAARTHLASIVARRRRFFAGPGGLPAPGRFCCGQGCGALRRRARRWRHGVDRLARSRPDAARPGDAGAAGGGGSRAGHEQRTQHQGNGGGEQGHQSRGDQGQTRARVTSVAESQPFRRSRTAKATTVIRRSGTVGEATAVATARTLQPSPTCSTRSAPTTRRGNRRAPETRPQVSRRGGVSIGRTCPRPKPWGHAARWPQGDFLGRQDAFEGVDDLWVEVRACSPLQLFERLRGRARCAVRGGKS
jgi:hypothetical protein